jgi:hypothetical protein
MAVTINVQNDETETVVDASEKTFEAIDDKVFRKTSGDWTFKAVERMLGFHFNREQSVDPETIKYILTNPAPFLKAMVETGDTLKNRWDIARKKIDSTGLNFRTVMATRDDSGFDPLVIALKKTCRYLQRLIEFIGYNDNGPGANATAPIYVWLAGSAKELGVTNPFKAVDAQIHRTDSILKGILG